MCKLKWGRIDQETTMNIGVLKCVSAVNVIPELTELGGEVKPFDLKKAEYYLNLLVDKIKSECELAGATFELVNDWDFVPFTVHEDSEIFEETIEAITKAGLIPTPKISLCGKYANSLNGLGIQSLNLCIGAQDPHSNDEFIFIEDLVKTAEIDLELVKKN